MDAIPGQTHQVIVTILKIGYYYGQCSELCGIGHGFMPISIYVLRFDQYLYWLITKFSKNFFFSQSDNIPHGSIDPQDSFKQILFEEYWIHEQKKNTPQTFGPGSSGSNAIRWLQSELIHDVYTHEILLKRLDNQMGVVLTNKKDFERLCYMDDPYYFDFCNRKFVAIDKRLDELATLKNRIYLEQFCR